MRQFHFDFYFLFRILDRNFDLIGFPNPIVVHSRPSFLLEQNFSFSFVFVQIRHFDIDFKFFKKIFDLILFCK